MALWIYRTSSSEMIFSFVIVLGILLIYLICSNCDGL